MGGKKKDNSADRANAEAERQRKQQELKMRNEQLLADQNAQAAVTKVEIGGTDTPETITDTFRKRKIQGTVSSQVGII
jgi:hypothetical protein